MVICLSDGTYNNPTYFEKKSKYEELTTKHGASTGYYNPKLPRLKQFLLFSEELLLKKFSRGLN